MKFALYHATLGVITAIVDTDNEESMELHCSDVIRARPADADVQPGTHYVNLKTGEIETRKPWNLPEIPARIIAGRKVVLVPNPPPGAMLCIQGRGSTLVDPVYLSPIDNAICFQAPFSGQYRGTVLGALDGPSFDFEAVASDDQLRADIARVQAAAGARIEAVFPLYAQLNALREGNQDDPRFAEVDAIRAWSNVIEDKLRAGHSIEEFQIEPGDGHAA